jgi:hypothetical protein
VKVERLFVLVLVLGIGSALARELIKLSKSNLFSSSAQQTKPAPPAAPDGKSSTKLIDKEYVAFRQEVLEKFLKSDFAAIDSQASQLRVSKERLPGGYWKLRAVYDAIEAPETGDQASDSLWQKHLQRLERWGKEQPQSITAKVALASAWKGYAWKARGAGFAESVDRAAWGLFGKRLESAAAVLEEARALAEGCPHWFVITLWVGIGQNWDRQALDQVFDAGIALEPTYYYLHQVKATYLLPRWGGEEGEWERFAEESTARVGGEQGDIIFFAIYSQMLSQHDLTFMNTHHQAGPRLLRGFRAIEKLYGASAHRLNEACYFSITAGDEKTRKELFTRIGEDYDQSVWRSRQMFDIFRGTIPQKPNAGPAATQSSAQIKRVS